MKVQETQLHNSKTIGENVMSSLTKRRFMSDKKVLSSMVGLYLLNNSILHHMCRK